MAQAMPINNKYDMRYSLVIQVSIPNGLLYGNCLMLGKASKKKQREVPDNTRVDPAKAIRLFDFITGEKPSRTK